MVVPTAHIRCKSNDCTWLYAGKSGESDGTNNISENPSGADNQQGSFRNPSETTRRAS